MTRALKDPRLSGILRRFVMQSFCHTAAYPADFTHHNARLHYEPWRCLPQVRATDDPLAECMLLPDTVGTGGDLPARLVSLPGGFVWWRLPPRPA